ncbi:hypothetical protein, partial [Pantoea ananatis]|uniref:hypothetical protein n=1 Tax=Pantoea ananas TaxID=553 RepID=UPI001B306D17
MLITDAKQGVDFCQRERPAPGEPASPHRQDMLIALRIHLLQHPCLAGGAFQGRQVCIDSGGGAGCPKRSSAGR